MAKGIPEDRLDPQFLIEHAERLTTGTGRPWTVDPHRATSAAYYAAYHTATRAITQFLFGSSWLHGVRWLSHRAVIDATRLVSKWGPAGVPDPGPDPQEVRNRALWSIFQEAGGVSPDLLDVMETLRSLKADREFADYDRTRSVSRAEAKNSIDQAKAVLTFFESTRVDAADTRAFFALTALKA